MRAFKLTIAYDGTDFAGWQVQPGVPTIQGLLQRAFRQVTGQEIQVVGSGRTDSGVHALAQVASCRCPWRDTPKRLAGALNANLPDTIVVHEASDAPPHFHAIRDAIGKTYRYQLQLAGPRDVFEYRYRWHLHGVIDIDRLHAAAGQFLGRHDFVSFQAAGSDRKTTTRTIRRCEVIEQLSLGRDGRYYAIEIEADGFLYNMVRNMVGTMVEVGRGKRQPAWIDQVIAGRNRDLAGPTAPPYGLFLVQVDYEPFDQASLELLDEI